MFLFLKEFNFLAPTSKLLRDLTPTDMCLTPLKKRGLTLPRSPKHDKYYILTEFTHPIQMISKNFQSLNKYQIMLEIKADLRKTLC